jgi:hypothetical protein
MNPRGYTQAAVRQQILVSSPSSLAAVLHPIITAKINKAAATT